jgi:ferredoxin
MEGYLIGSALFEVTHATPRYLLSRRHSDKRAPDAGIADLQRKAGVLFPRPAGRECGDRRRIREGDWSAPCGSRRSRPDGAGRLRRCCGAKLAAHWKASAYKSILELAEACDVPVRWSCLTSVCHNCESGLVSGAVVYGPEPLDKPADGNLLVCCSQPIRGVVIDL